MYIYIQLLYYNLEAVLTICALLSNDSYSSSTHLLGAQSICATQWEDINI